VPPLAAAAALAVGLGVLKRVVARSAPVYGSTSEPDPHPAAPGVHLAALGNGYAAPESGREAAERFAPELAAGHVPSVRAIRREMHLGQPKAQEVHRYLSALTP